MNLDELMKWLTSSEFLQELNNVGATVTAQVRPALHSSVLVLVADFDSPTAVGKIICWADRGCDFEVARFPARLEYSQTLDEVSLDAIKACMPAFLGAMSSGVCYHQAVENRTQPKTAGQWLRYVVVAVIALFLVWWMLRAYVL